MTDQPNTEPACIPGLHGCAVAHVWPCPRHVLSVPADRPSTTPAADYATPLTPRTVMVGLDAVAVVDATVLAQELRTHVRSTALLVDTSHAHALMRVLRRVLPYDQGEREALERIHTALHRHLIG